MSLDPAGDLVTLFRAIVDIESVSGHERELADEVAAALAGCDHLRVERDGDTVIARTFLGRPERVVIAGHLDTVPLAGNLPSWVEGDLIYGRGTCDMKGGIAVMLAVAVGAVAPVRDLTWIFYDHEEVESSANSLTRLAETRPDWLAGDFAVLMEPTGAKVEGGCQGTLRFTVTTRGTAAHSARAWMGHNAIHDAAAVLAALAAHEPEQPEVDGLRYHEGLNAVSISGGIAGNVIPGRLHDQRQLPVRPAPFDRAGPAVLSRPAARPRTHLRGRRRRRQTRSRPARRRSLRRRGGRTRIGQVRLDGRGPVRRAGYSGGELRPWQPRKGPCRRRVLPGGRLVHLSGRPHEMARLSLISATVRAACTLARVPFLGRDRAPPSE